MNIKTCPFCGKGEIEWDMTVKKGYIFEKCEFCKARGPLAQDSDEALRRWNVRSLTALEKDVEKIEDFLLQIDFWLRTDSLRKEAEPFWMNQYQAMVNEFIGEIKRASPSVPRELFEDK